MRRRAWCRSGWPRRGRPRSTCGAARPSSRDFSRLWRRRPCQGPWATWTTVRNTSYLRPTTGGEAWGWPWRSARAWARVPVLNRGLRGARILLDEGHLWGKRRVAIPISAVADFSDGVRLSLARDEVRDLPAAGPVPGEE